MHLHLHVALDHTPRERARAARSWADAFDTSLTSQRERYIAQARHGQALGLLILRAQRREACPVCSRQIADCDCASTL